MKELLKKLNACQPAREWADDKTIEEIWATCYRGDWMLWLARKLNIDKRVLTLAKGHCANTVRHLMKDERSIAAVDMAIKYGEGNATDSDLAAAAAAAYAADAATAYTAYAADAAAYAAAFAARKKSQQATAEICRKYIPLDLILSGIKSQENIS